MFAGGVAGVTLAWCRSRVGVGVSCRCGWRSPVWHAELINLVIISDVDATASDHAGVPFARAGHLSLCRRVNYCAGVAIVAV